MTEGTEVIAAEWHSPSGASGRRWRFRWSALLWQLVFPRGGHRVMPTVSGTLLILLSFGIGTAAYNTANNILFITLSLLLACLILSGVVSWLNFRDVAWRMRLAPPFRAGQETAVAIDLRNEKKFLPTYGLWFDLMTRPVPPESAVDAPRTEDRPVREILAAYERSRTRRRLFLRGRLDPAGTARIDWVFKPAQRGRQRVELQGVGSLFPFGFLQKQIGNGSWREVIVWPASIEYRSWGTGSTRPQASGLRTARAGNGGDLRALRKYEQGDSHRLIHWKASARMRQLLVRQFAAESQQTVALWLQTPAEVWHNADQFELLVSLAASLAEDMFHSGKLATVALNAQAARLVRRVRDLESFLDDLAVIQPQPGGYSGPAAGGGRNVLTFAPEGTRGVAAYIDGQKAAAT